MRLLWYIVIFFIAYGSLYPFNFDFSRPIPADLGEWLMNWEQRTIRSDVIANILLFIPYGFLGALSIQQQRRRHLLFSIAVMLIVGIIFAFCLQFIQFYLPSRVSHAADALLNAVGILIGIALAAYTNSQRMKRMIPAGLRLAISPAFLVLFLWIGWQFFPYMPVFESQQFGQSLDTIVKSTWSLFAWFQYVLMWLVFYHLLKEMMGKDFRIGFIVLISIFLIIIKLAMYRSQMGWSEVTAIPLAVILHHLLAQRWMIPMLAISSTLLLLWNTIYPLSFQQHMNNFQWLPFDDFLKGSTWYNLSELIEESLILSSIGYFTAKWWRNYRSSGLFLLCLAIGITLVQLFLVGKQPDITLSVMALVIGILLERLKSIQTAH
ncbi:VanZ family protein [Kangiella sediminilitoris]|uniref:VanZ family protein n=1 Tax=Kangiella sediminilitoris TaxID=1144748 RepID=A0A1B3B7Q3_9GAMM|nr:VanZ family protein [Kangiella sediminilitoris]AOE48819.1 VanZ family protein [Kangiella sediminilitoris]